MERAEATGPFPLLSSPPLSLSLSLSPLLSVFSQQEHGGLEAKAGRDDAAALRREQDAEYEAALARDLMLAAAAKRQEEAAAAAGPEM